MSFALWWVHNAPVDENTKYPVVLAKKHPLIYLVAKDAHGCAKHSGVKVTSTFLGEKYWISVIRNSVQSVTRKVVKWAANLTRPRSAAATSKQSDRAPPFSIDHRMLTTQAPSTSGSPTEVEAKHTSVCSHVPTPQELLTFICYCKNLNILYTETRERTLYNFDRHNLQHRPAFCQYLG